MNEQQRHALLDQLFGAPPTDAPSTPPPVPPSGDDDDRPERADYVWDIVDEDGKEFTLMAYMFSVVGINHFIFWDANHFIVKILRNFKSATPRYGANKP